METDDYESLPDHVPATTHMLAGAGAGIMEHCVMYPLDVVKTRMQSLQPNPRAAYRSVTEALVKIVKHEGIGRPFKGMSVMVAGAGPAHAMYFSCYEKMKRTFSGTKNGSKKPLAQGAAGVCATILHDAVMTPADVVKQRLQVYGSPYRTVLQCVRDIYTREGLKAFYRSYGTQLTMNVPFQSIHFVIYEAMIELTNPERRYNPQAHMLSGAVAGAVAAAATNPLDVCKTLLNTQETAGIPVASSSSLTSSGINKRSVKTPKQIRGLFAAARTIYSCCGPRGFFQGLQARVMYTMPSTAIAWSVYELFKFLIINHNNHLKDNSGRGSSIGSSSSSSSSSPPTSSVNSLPHIPGLTPTASASVAVNPVVVHTVIHQSVSSDPPFSLTAKCDHHHHPVIKDAV